MPTGVLRQNKHNRLVAFIARKAEGRKPSGIAIADVPDGLRRAAKLRSKKLANGVLIYALKLCGIKPFEVLNPAHRAG